MRMRKKKHLDERVENNSFMYLCIDKNFTNLNEALKNKVLIDYKSVFNNDNPIELEIGCGKGKFITEKAELNSNVNYIGVELIGNVLISAVELATKKGLQNVRFMNTAAQYLPRYLKENSVDKIYLNFSPPYHGNSYENRRLTNPVFIKEYSYLLKENGIIYQKTDDLEFFNYSFQSLINNGYEVIDISDVLGDINNIRTEYEINFINKGYKIYGLKAIKKQSN